MTNKGLICGFALGAALFATQAVATTFSDGTFANTDWTEQILPYPQSDPGATFISTQVASGGNPGAYRQTTHSYVGPDRGIIVGHLGVTEIYDPSAGAISSINYSYDANFFNYPGSGPIPSFGVGFGALLRQGGQLYLAPGAPLVSPSWVHFSFSASSSDFVLLNGLSHPDFSTGGSAIQFGYYTSNATCCAAPTSTISGVDNWRVEIQPGGAVPEPATWAMMVIGFGGMGAMLRRRGALLA